MYRHIKEAMVDQIQDIAWMDNTTKSRARDKVSS